jgi:hypothetical protein
MTFNVLPEAGVSYLTNFTFTITKDNITKSRCNYGFLDVVQNEYVLLNADSTTKMPGNTNEAFVTVLPTP